VQSFNYLSSGYKIVVSCQNLTLNVILIPAFNLNLKRKDRTLAFHCERLCDTGWSCAFIPGHENERYITSHISSFGTVHVYSEVS
jgi:hypothetical protein